MMNSFDIQDADTMNTLILICKTDLKMNQALDCSDFEGYQKLSKVSNDLRKSAKFTAAQNKEKKDDGKENDPDKKNDNEKDIYFAGRHAFSHFCWRCLCPAFTS